MAKKRTWKVYFVNGMTAQVQASSKRQAYTIAVYKVNLGLKEGEEKMEPTRRFVMEFTRSGKCRHGKAPRGRGKVKALRRGYRQRHVHTSEVREQPRIFRNPLGFEVAY